MNIVLTPETHLRAAKLLEEIAVKQSEYNQLMSGINIPSTLPSLLPSPSQTRKGRPKGSKMSQAGRDKISASKKAYWENKHKEEAAKEAEKLAKKVARAAEKSGVSNAPEQPATEHVTENIPVTEVAEPVAA